MERQNKNKSNSRRASKGQAQITRDKYYYNMTQW